MYSKDRRKSAEKRLERCLKLEYPLKLSRQNLPDLLEVSMPNFFAAFSAVFERLNQTFHGAIDWLTGKDEISVKCSKDANGKLCWTIHDFYSMRTLRFTDERAVLSWLENRFR